MRLNSASYSAFAAFGLFWGAWGAALPALRERADTDTAGLGIALLFIGAGALPAMFFTGRAVDRFGARIAGLFLVALAGAGVVIVMTGDSWTTMVIGMALVGATSGAADVAANALAGSAEERSGGRVITVAHGVFSSCVVIGSLGTGALLAFGATVVTVFLLVGICITVAGATVLILGGGEPRPARAAPRGEPIGWAYLLPFVGVGLVGALAFAVENAHQSWSAIFLADELGASAGLAAIAPATFALCAALARFAAGACTRVRPTVLLIGGAAGAMIGTVLVSVSSTAPAAIAGLGLAAAGTSLLFPTLLSSTLRDVPPDRQGRVTSAVATTSYVGFIIGPAYFGMLAHFIGLRGALVGAAALALAFALLAPALARRTPHPSMRWQQRG